LESKALALDFPSKTLAEILESKALALDFPSKTLAEILESKALALDFPSKALALHGKYLIKPKFWTPKL
jgi:hypothetical protein